MNLFAIMYRGEDYIIHDSQGVGAASFPEFPSCAGKSLQVGVAHLTKNRLPKGSFPLIAKPNSHARCENFHPITIFKTNSLQAFE